MKIEILAAFVIMTVVPGLVESSCGAGLSLHFDNGVKRCCKSVMCHPGTKAVMCRNHGEPATCIGCEQGFFLAVETESAQMIACHLKRSCRRRGQVVVSEGGPSENRRCRCNQLEGFYDPDPSRCTYNNCPFNCKRESCKAGMETNETGQCKHCDSGHFKSTEGYGSCQSQTHCLNLGMEYVSHGNLTHDSICVNKTLPDIPTTTASLGPVGMRGIKEDEDQPMASILTIGLIAGGAFLFVICVLIIFVVFNRKRCPVTKPERPISKSPDGSSLSRSQSGISIMADDNPPLLAKNTRMTSDGNCSIDTPTGRKDFLPHYSHQDSGVFPEIVSEGQSLLLDGVASGSLAYSDSPGETIPKQVLRSSPNTMEGTPEQSPSTGTKTRGCGNTVKALNATNCTIIIGDRTKVLYGGSSLSNLNSADSGIGPEYMVEELPDEECA